MRAIYFLAVFLGVIVRAEATTISYDVNNIAGNRWEYSYTINNDTLSGDIEEFTIYFAVGSYENLIAGTTPGNWDSLVTQPDVLLPANGFYDSLALVSGIAPNASLSGFSVAFDFLGSGTPGSQPYDIIDPLTFQTLDSGNTRINSSHDAPEPGLFSMLALGLSVFLVISGRGRHGLRCHYQLLKSRI